MTPAYDPALLAFVNELEEELGGVSGRGLAILGAAGLDYLLGRLLEAAVAPGTYRPLTDNHGPLATFSARINMAYSLNLISANEHNELDLIRKIRNAFAHELAGASFQTASISDRCRALEIGLDLYAPKTIPFAESEDGVRYIPYDPESVQDLPTVDLSFPNPNDARLRFASAVSVMSHILTNRIIQRDMHGPSTTPLAEFNYPEDINVSAIEALSVQVAKLEQLIDRAEDLGSRAEHMVHGRGSGYDIPEGVASIREDVKQLIEPSKSDLHQAQILLAILRHCSEVLRRSRAAA